MGNYLSVLKIGETIDINGKVSFRAVSRQHAEHSSSTFTGPIGGIEYLGHGDFEIEGQHYHFDKLNLVAGGSGITPHWQLIHSILKNPDDKTKISLIDCNKTFNDILLLKELRNYAKTYQDRFKIWHAVEKAPEEGEELYWWSKGFCNEQLMRERFFALNKDDKVGTFLCGPPGLIKYGVMPGMKNMGFRDGETVFGY